MNKIAFYRCSCFFKTNIYLEQIGVHVHYTHDEQFREEYQHVSKIYFTFYIMTDLNSSSLQHRKLILNNY